MVSYQQYLFEAPSPTFGSPVHLKFEDLKNLKRSVVDIAIGHFAPKPKLNRRSTLILQIGRSKEEDERNSCDGFFFSFFFLAAEQAQVVVDYNGSKDHKNQKLY